MSKATKSSFRGAAFAACVFALTACQSSAPADHPKETSIITDPTGARGEINGDSIGPSPVKYTFRQSPVGTILGNYIITVTPVEANLQPQSRRLEGPYVPLTGHADEVPAKLFFDLRRPPPDPEGF